MSESSEFRHLGGGRKGLFLLLRYIFIAAASYLVLLHQPEVDSSHAFMIAVALLSNVALSIVAPSLVFSWYVEAPVLIADTLWVSWAMHSAGAAGQEFFLLYFFVLSLAALGESLALVLLGSTILSLINVYLSGWHPNNLIQVVFFYTVALFYGYVIKEIKAERQRADRGVLWVRELEAMVERRTAELSRLYEALTESETRYRVVSEMMSDFAYAATIGAESVTFDWVTDSFSRIAGYAPEDLGRMGWRDLVHPDDLARVEKEGLALLLDKPVVTEYHIITKSGDVRRLRTHIKPVRDARGETRLYGAGQDITARARLEDEQTRMREVLEATPDLVGISDPQGKVLYYNGAGRRMLGIADDAQLAADHASHHQPAWAWQLIRDEAIPTALRTGSWQGEGAILGPDRTEIPVSQVVVAHRGRDGRVTALSTVARDITEQKQMEEGLQREVRISTAMARVGRELIAVRDASAIVDRLCLLTPELMQCDIGATLMLNPDTTDLTPVGWCGGDMEESKALSAIGMSGEARVHLIESLRIDDVVEVCHADPSLNGGAGADASMAWASRSGVATTLYMALRRGGTLIGCHTASYAGRGRFSAEQKRVAHGIANLASLALENSRLTASLEKANRLKSEFVATMSHELRTPLNVILGLTDLLREGEYGDISDEQRGICNRIEHSGWTLLELINSTLDLSRLEQGRVAIDHRATDVGKVLDQLRLEIEPLVQRKTAVQMVWNTPPDLAEVRTDAAKLKVVIKNLITNALKFTEVGSVTVSTAVDGDLLEVEVADTGEGIPDDQLAAIFEPFRQVDGSSTRRHDGVGLGLHIVRRYARLLGGDVSVTSQPGRGSVFRVRVPSGIESQDHYQSRAS